jgi:endonuclease V
MVDSTPSQDNTNADVSKSASLTQK